MTGNDRRVLAVAAALAAVGVGSLGVGVARGDQVDAEPAAPSTTVELGEVGEVGATAQPIPPTVAPTAPPTPVTPPPTTAAPTTAAPTTAAPTTTEPPPPTAAPEQDEDEWDSSHCLAIVELETLLDIFHLDAQAHFGSLNLGEEGRFDLDGVGGKETLGELLVRAIELGLCIRHLGPIGSDESPEECEWPEQIRRLLRDEVADSELFEDREYAAQLRLSCDPPSPEPGGISEGGLP